MLAGQLTLTQYHATPEPRREIRVVRDKETWQRVKPCHVCYGTLSS
jgi:hypothetical protein